MHREIPRSQLLVIPGCGHLAPSECPVPVLQGTVEFLKGREEGEGKREEEKAASQ
jgi:pimeloyl-ACP methyl ester carboxylesterase